MTDWKCGVCGGNNDVVIAMKIEPDEEGNTLCYCDKCYSGVEKDVDMDKWRFVIDRREPDDYECECADCGVGLSYEDCVHYEEWVYYCKKCGVDENGNVEEDICNECYDRECKCGTFIHTGGATDGSEADDEYSAYRPPRRTYSGVVESVNNYVYDTKDLKALGEKYSAGDDIMGVLAMKSPEELVGIILEMDKVVQQHNADIGMLCELVMPLPKSAKGIYQVKMANLYFNVKKLVEESGKTDSIVDGYRMGYAKLLDMINGKNNPAL